MTTLIIPLVLLAAAAVLIVLVGVHEHRKPDEWEPVSAFEQYQREKRAARRRAEWRQQQRTIDNERGATMTKELNYLIALTIGLIGFLVVVGAGLAH